MPVVSPSVPFEPVVEDMVRADPRYANALLEEAMRVLLDNEIAVARNLIRHVIKGGIGYAELSRRTGTPETSLVRMFGPKGNPTLANAFAVIAELQRHAGLKFQVSSVPVRRGKTAARRPARRRAA